MPGWSAASDVLGSCLVDVLSMDFAACARTEISTTFLALALIF